MRDAPTPARRIGLGLALIGALFFAVGARPVRAQDPLTIVDITVVGARTIDAGRVRALSGLPGERVASPRVLQQAIRTLWRTNLFNDVAITTRPVPGGRAGVVVIVQVVEAPVITAFTYDGVDELKAEEVSTAIGLKPGDRLLEHRLHQAALDLEGLYREKGYYLADVRITPARPEADSTAVMVTAEEGRKVAVEQITFRGNQALSEERLRDALETETDGFWFWQDGQFDAAEWRADLAQRLPALYGSSGYLDMRVVGDSIAIDPERGEMRLLVTVEEGRQYRTGDVAIEGNNRFSRSDLERFLRLEPGQVFDTESVEKTQGDLLNLYADDGYIYAQVQPVRRARADTALVDLTWQIREGNPARIQHIAIKGNTVTHESVIRRHLFVTPGERFRRTDVRNSLLSLEGLGFFEPGIVPATRVVDEQTGDIDLTFEVEERRTGSLTLGAAIGGGTGLSGFIGYEQPNLFGQAKAGSIRWEFGTRNNNLELSYTEPVFLGSRTSFSTSFFNINRRYIGTSFRQDALGGNIRFGTPLPWDDAARFFYGYKWQRIDLQSNDDDDSRFADEYPRRESSVNLGLVRDTRLPRRHPVQGARHNLSTDLAGGPFGGSVDFQKVEFETSWFAPTYNDRTVLNLLLKAGGINGSGFVPLNEQFILGGVQYPSQGLRGYPENRVGVHTAGNRFADETGRADDRGNGFLLLTAEHFVKITDTVYVSAFYDAGNVWNEFRDVTFGDLKRGAGVGISVDLPGFGPLGLDYAYGFDRRNEAGEPAPAWQLHFRFGNLAR